MRVSAKFAALLAHPKAPLAWALLATLLVLPTLGLGFHLDDYVHRFLLSGLPGSAELEVAYESPFGIANGERAWNLWQIEAGYAPWWIHPDLLISLLRPVSELAHRVDALLIPDHAPLQHAHSLVWHFALVLLAGLLYRSVLGAGTLAGLAALLYAVDHTHGFAIGWIANRNALIAGSLGVLALLCHHAGRARRRPGLVALGAIAFALALFAGEGAIAIFGYLLGYGLFLDPRKHRFTSLLPHLGVIGLWRLAYAFFDRGARYSGLYIDPAREPVAFAAAMLERIPVLFLGQIGLPPAEVYVFAPAALSLAIWTFALLLLSLAIYAVLPMLRADARARFFAFGMSASLVPACTTHPNNRLLFFVGIGALALVAMLWHGFLERAHWLRAGAWRRVAGAFAALALGFHLFASPVLLVFSACSIALTAPAETAARAALPGAAGKDLVIVNSPDYYYVKLLRPIAALERRPAPNRLFALSFGAVPVRIERLAPDTLELRFAGGLLGQPLLELYRARELTMAVGDSVELPGLRIEVTALTPDGRIAAARYRFARPLEDPGYRFVRWDGERYAPFTPPAPGRGAELPPAGLRFGL